MLGIARRSPKVDYGSFNYGYMFRNKITSHYTHNTLEENISRKQNRICSNSNTRETYETVSYMMKYARERVDMFELACLLLTQVLLKPNFGQTNKLAKLLSEN